MSAEDLSATLRQCRALLARDRAALIECHTDPKTGGIPVDDADAIYAVAEYDDAIAAADAALIAAPVDEREAFEAWAVNYHKTTNPGPLTKLDGGRYFYGPVNASWLAWQARASLAAPPAPAQAPAEPDMRHPKIQALIGGKARREIELRLVEQLIDNPDCDLSSMDMEYWRGLHDKLREALLKQAAPVVVMRPMDFDDGRVGWYISTPEFYCDIEPDADGRWSVYFRDAASGAEAFGEQAAPVAPAGWRLVPVEPTYHMLRESLIPAAEAARYYSRMLAAAPQSASEPASAEGLPCAMQYAASRSMAVTKEWCSGWDDALAALSAKDQP